MKKLQVKRKKVESDHCGEGHKYQMISSLLSVPNVELFTHTDNICWHITDLNMRESSILVISVIIKLHNRVVSRDTYQQSTVTQF